MDRVRVMRIIIYEGSREWVEKTLERSIHGTRIMTKFGELDGRITAHTVNEFPEIIKKHEEGINNGTTI